MQVTNATTFTQIRAQFDAGGQFDNAPAGKNLRLNTASGLHIHREDKGSGVHFMKRAEKHENAVAAIKRSIDNELGPGAGATVFKNLGLKGTVSVGDMNAVKAEFDRLANARSILPAQGFELSPVRGDPSLVAATFEHQTKGVELTGFRNELDSKFATYNKAAPDAPNVTTQFMKDFNRMNIRLVDGGRASNVPQGNGEAAQARAAVAGFAGGDETATRTLSNFLSQTAFNTMHGQLTDTLRTAADDKVLVFVANSPPGGPKNQTVTASTDGPDHILIDYKLDTGISGLSAGGRTINLSERDDSRLTATMQLRVATADLAAGRLDHQITKPPSFELHTRFDPVNDVLG